MHAQQNNTGLAAQTRFSDAEWEARVELAALYRLIHHFKLTDLIYNHISLRIPGTQDRLLINPYGLWYDEITASNLVEITLDGEVVYDPVGLGINQAGYIIHGAIHAARHDLACVMHTHTRAGCAVSAQEEGLLPISQHAAWLIGRIAYHEFEGIALRPDEQERLVGNMGSMNMMILCNHGLLTAGTSAAEALSLMLNLERACDIQVAALAGGVPIRRISDLSIRHTREAYEQHGNNYSRLWTAMMRLARRVAPDLES